MTMAITPSSLRHLRVCDHLIFRDSCSHGCARVTRSLIKRSQPGSLEPRPCAVFRNQKNGPGFLPLSPCSPKNLIQVTLEVSVCWHQRTNSVAVAVELSRPHSSSVRNERPRAFSCGKRFILSDAILVSSRSTILGVPNCVQTESPWLLHSIICSIHTTWATARFITSVLFRAAPGSLPHGETKYVEGGAETLSNASRAYTYICWG